MGMFCAVNGTSYDWRKLAKMLFSGIMAACTVSWKFLGAIAIVEAIYALGIVIAGEKLVSAKPFSLLATIAILIVIGVTARLLLRRLKKRKPGIGIVL